MQEISGMGLNPGPAQAESIQQAYISKNLHFNNQNDQQEITGIFFSEDADVFVITPNKWTFFFAETENLNFGDWKLVGNWGYFKVLKA